MRKLIKFLIFILALVGFFFIFEILPKGLQYKKENPWISDRVLIIPHGGAKELYPENTKYSFVETDIYDAFEVDLALTKDNILISHHDLNLKMHLGSEYESVLIRNKTYQEIIDLFILEDYPFARNFTDPEGNKPYQNLASDDEVLTEMIPATLDWLFENYPDKMYILEIKDTKIEADFTKAVEVLLEKLEEYQMTDQVIISSFEDQVIKEVLKKAPLHTSTAPNETFKFVLMSAFNIDFFYKPKQAALIIPVHQTVSSGQAKIVKFLPVKNKFMADDKTTDLSKTGLINDVKRHNMALIYWTINDEAEMRRLIELGVDGIITDRPDLLKEILKEYE